MSAATPGQPDVSSTVSQRRTFRPTWWAFLLTIAVVVVTVRLGNWQGERASYRQQQQRLQDQGIASAPLTAEGLSAIAGLGDADRYRLVTMTVTFLPDKILFVDNRISDGKAGYGVLQLIAAPASNQDPQSRYYLLDRGWVAAPPLRDKLPEIDSPTGVVAIQARLNLPPSRNPGSATNDGSARLNYVNIDELAARWRQQLAPFVLEQTAGPGFTGVGRPAAGTNYEKNLIYQMQWYSFAALAVVLFLVLSFRKQAPR